MSSKVKRIIYVSHDQLNAEYGGLAKADKKSDLVLFVESARMIKGRKWHAHRLHFIISSAQHFSAELKEKGFTVEYLKAENTAAGIEEIKKKYKISEVIAAQPSSFRLLNALSKLNVKFVDNDFFLTPRSLFHSWAVEQKSFKMETFYRKQRVRLNLLMKGDKPIGDKWNHDADNQLPPPKNYSWPKYLKHDFDQIDEAVWLDLKSLDLIGSKPSGDFATTRQGALKQLSHFLKYSFAEFGPYEDAIALDSWSLHHSLLSPYLNNGLLHPSEVIAAAIKVFNKEKIPISSCEGFIRQIIGWREYVNGMYWFLGEKYKNVNHFSANRKLLPLFNDPDKTEMNCVKSTINDIHKRAWVHHIPRLMILSNLALMTEINPQEFFEWMREVFIDATDWMMVPNIIGMGLYADGGVMMTKPYAAGGAYISRMSNYCKPCKFDPKLRSGDNACPFTTLYWDFMDRNKDEFAKNHRMSQQVFGLKRLKDLPETRKRAQEILELLSAGKV